MKERFANGDSLFHVWDDESLYIRFKDGYYWMAMSGSEAELIRNLTYQNETTLTELEIEYYDLRQWRDRVQ